MNSSTLPLVSILIPNFNHAPYLQKRIDSVLAQSFSSFEVIILDDKSTDNSVQVIEQYRHHPTVAHVILNEVNSGSPFIQWERGLQLCKGEIIWIAESDDYADPNLLEKLVPLFSDKVGLVYCDSNVIDAESKLLPEFYKKFRNERFKTQKWSSDYVQDGITELRDNLFFECTVNNMSATLFKKELLKHVDWPYLKSFRYCGDWYFLISLALHTHIAYCCTALNYFKYGTNNFKEGTRSILNYFRERFKARYSFWKRLSISFSRSEKDRLYKEMGTEMRIQINEMIKGKSPVKKTMGTYRELKRLDKALFLHQVLAAFKGYIWKN